MAGGKRIITLLRMGGCSVWSSSHICKLEAYNRRYIDRHWFFAVSLPSYLDKFQKILRFYDGIAHQHDAQS